MKLVTTDTTVSTRFTGRVSGILLAVLFLVGLGNISFKTQFQKPLYLMDKAMVYVSDSAAFESKVRKISDKLDIDADWLMAVMYNESRFNVSVKNYQGSGATGLIQFMPKTAKGDLNISIAKLKNMDHVTQLDYVYDYLNTVKKRYRPFEELTDVYIAVLYPKALAAQDSFVARRKRYPGVKKWMAHHDNFVLYARPSKKYKLNSGLDENKDGKVTIYDIRAHVQRRYPEVFDNTPSPEEILAITDSAKIWAQEDFIDEIETRGEALGIEFLKTYAHQILLNVERHRQKKVDGIASK